MEKRSAQGGAKSGSVGRLKDSPPREVMVFGDSAGKEEEEMGAVLVGENPHTAATALSPPFPQNLKTIEPT